MKRLKYIRKVAEAHPYEYENPPICKVELWDFSRANENDEARKEAVCLVASISYGNEYCKDPDRLWNLLIERGHESPFEFVRSVYVADGRNMNLRNEEFLSLDACCEEAKRDELTAYEKYITTFKLKVPIFVARQIQRHRSFSYMEMSRRYVRADKVKLEFWFPDELGLDVIHPLDPEDNVVHWIDEEIYRWFYDYCTDEYIGIGIKPEQARAYLPLGLYTQFWMQGDYRAWLNFFIHRLHPEAQEETRLVAEAMWRLLKEHQPGIIETMADYLDEWVNDCNPIFRQAREKRAKWFTERFL